MKRGHTEYLQELQQKKKWTKSTWLDLSEDEPKLSMVHMVATVKTSNGEYKCSVGKIYPLPVSERTDFKVTEISVCIK